MRDALLLPSLGLLLAAALPSSSVAADPPVCVRFEDGAERSLARGRDGSLLALALSRQASVLEIHRPESLGSPHRIPLTARTRELPLLGAHLVALDGRRVLVDGSWEIALVDVDRGRVRWQIDAGGWVQELAVGASYAWALTEARLTVIALDDGGTRTVEIERGHHRLVAAVGDDLVTCEGSGLCQRYGPRLERRWRRVVQAQPEALRVVADRVWVVGSDGARPLDRRGRLGAPLPAAPFDAWVDEARAVRRDDRGLHLVDLESGQIRDWALPDDLPRHVSPDGATWDGERLLAWRRSGRRLWLIRCREETCGVRAVEVGDTAGETVARWVGDRLIAGSEDGLRVITPDGGVERVEGLRHLALLAQLDGPDAVAMSADDRRVCWWGAAAAVRGGRAR